MCHYCYEPAELTAAHYRRNGRLRRLFRLPTRRYLVDVCFLHSADPAAYNHPANRAARVRLDRWVREDNNDRSRLVELEAVAEDVRRRREGLR